MPKRKKLSLKRIRTLAARKGARTKREAKQLSHAVHCQRLLRAGMTPQEIAVSESMPLREVLRLLRLAAFIPHPIGRAIGLGATVAEEGFRISEGRFGQDVQGFVEGARREINNLGNAVGNIQKTVDDIRKVLPKLKGLP